MIPTTFLVFGGVALVLILALAVLWIMYFLRLPGYVKTATKPYDLRAELQCMADSSANSQLSDTELGHVYGKPELATELKVLANLHEKGSLTDAEFEQAKTKLLK